MQWLCVLSPNELMAGCRECGKLPTFPIMLVMFCAPGHCALFRYFWPSVDMLYRFLILCSFEIVFAQSESPLDKLYAKGESSPTRNCDSCCNSGVCGTPGQSPARCAERRIQTPLSSKLGNTHYVYNSKVGTRATFPPRLAPWGNLDRAQEALICGSPYANTSKV